MFKDLWNVKPVSAHSTSFGIGKKVFLYLKVNSAYDFIFSLWKSFFGLQCYYINFHYLSSLWEFEDLIYIYIYSCSGESQDTFTIKRKIIYIFVSLYS